MFDLFKTLLGANKQTQSLLLLANSQFCEMLDMAAELLEQSLPAITDPSAVPTLGASARDIDKISNRCERSIRKLLVEHLGFSTADAPACLVLMSVAKDAERIVDLVRELIGLCPDLPAAYRGQIQAEARELVAVVQATRKAFAGNDQRNALDLVEHEKPDLADYAKIQQALLADNGDHRANTLGYLALRLLLRIRAHLGNIATTVVFPVHRIDFVRSKFIEQARKDIG
jgi:phosphate uptake regulator